jgi:hypothetical protein
MCVCAYVYPKQKTEQLTWISNIELQHTSYQDASRPQTGHRPDERADKAHKLVQVLRKAA